MATHIVRSTGQKWSLRVLTAFVAGLCWLIGGAIEWAAFPMRAVDGMVTGAWFLLLGIAFVAFVLRAESPRSGPAPLWFKAMLLVLAAPLAYLALDAGVTAVGQASAFTRMRWFIPPGALLVAAAAAVTLSRVSARQRHSPYSPTMWLTGLGAVGLLWLWLPEFALDAGRAPAGRRWVIGGDYRNGTGAAVLATLIVCAGLEAAVMFFGVRYFTIRTSILRTRGESVRVAIFGAGALGAKLFAAIALARLGLPTAWGPSVALTGVPPYVWPVLYVAGAGWFLQTITRQVLR